MRWNSFPRSLAFAALAAAGVALWLILAGPALGGARAAGVYLAFATAAYLGGLASSVRHRVVTWVATAAIAAAIACVARSLTEEALALAALIGIARSVFLFRAAAPRAVVTEALLLASGLLFARFLAAPTLAGTALPIWGFFLVQSLYFLVGGVRRRRESGGHPDPFEEACRRASALLDAP